MTDKKMLELEARIWKDDLEAMLEGYADGEWRYLKIEDLLKDFQRYGLAYNETSEGIKIFGPIARTGLNPVTHYFLVGRQQHMIHQERIDDEYTPVRRINFFSCDGQGLTEKLGGYPHYAFLSLRKPDGELLSAEDSDDVLPIKIVVLKNILDLYIGMKQISSPPDYVKMLDKLK